MNMIINILGRYIVTVDIKLRKIISVIENDLGLIRYLLKIFREYTIIEDKNGYLKFENKTEGEVYLHRVIMEYYSQYNTKLYTVLTNPSYYEINHINKNKWDNRLENLEFVTHKNNIKHSKGLEYETIMTSQEIIQIKDKLKEDRQYQSNKKYLEKVSNYNKKYLSESNLYYDVDKKFFDNLYIRFSNKNISSTKTIPNTTNINILSCFNNIIFPTYKNTFSIYYDSNRNYFTINNSISIYTNYNIYRTKNILQNNLQLIFKYYKQNKYFRSILNKYNLLNHTTIEYKYDSLKHTIIIDKSKIDLNTNIIIDLFYYLLPTPLNITFYKNDLFISVSIKDIILTYKKYNSFKILYDLQLLNRINVPYKPISHTVSSFIIPKYTDDLFTTTVLPLSKTLHEMDLTKITHTILTKNQTLEIAQRVYKNTNLKTKTHKDLFTITDIIKVLNSSSILERVQKYGFITVSHIRKELQLMNPNIQEKDDSFITSMVRNITEIKDLLKILKVEYMIINNKTKEKIKHYQEKNELEETNYEGITFNQRIIVLKKLVVKNTRNKKSHKKK